MKAGENPVLSFYFRKVPLKTPALVSLIIVILTLTAGIFLTRSVWLKPGWKSFLFGIILPVVVALIMCRWYGKPLILDWIILVPLAYFAWRTGIYIGQKIKSTKEKKAAFIREIDELKINKGEVCRSDIHS